MDLQLRRRITNKGSRPPAFEAGGLSFPVDVALNTIPPAEYRDGR